jgi:hypothetical protein
MPEPLLLSEGNWETLLEVLGWICQPAAFLCIVAILLHRKHHGYNQRIIETQQEFVESVTAVKEALQEQVFTHEEPEEDVPLENDDLTLRLKQVDSDNWVIEMLDGEERVLMTGARPVPKEYAELMMNRVMDYTDDNSFTEGEDDPLV